MNPGAVGVSVSGRTKRTHPGELANLTRCTPGSPPCATEAVSRKRLTRQEPRSTGLAEPRQRAESFRAEWVFGDAVDRDVSFWRARKRSLRETTGGQP